MRTLCAAAVVGFAIQLMQCSTKETKTGESIDDTTSYEAEIIQPEKIDLRGDFNGDGQKETAVLRLIRKGESQDIPWIYTIVFSDPVIHSFTFTTEVESPHILNEGPLNNIPGDELSIITQASMTDDSYVNVYSLSDGLWGTAMESIGLPISLPDSLGFEDVIFVDSGKVFHFGYENKLIPGSSNPDGNNFEISYYKTNATLYASIEPMSHRFLEEEVMGSIDADGDGAEEMMRIVVVFDSVETSYSRLEFSDPKIKPMAVGGNSCSGEVYVEGDLDGLPGSELSVLDCGFMRNYNFISTFSYVNNRWKKRIDGIHSRDIIPEGFTREDIIFKENGDVYYYEDEELDVFISTGNKDGMKKVKAEWIP